MLALAFSSACSVDNLSQDEQFVLHPFVVPTYYAVQQGDSLSLIAKAHDVTVRDLRAWNGIESDLIDVGQVLLIWDDDALPKVADAHPVHASAHAVTYVSAAQGRRAAPAARPQAPGTAEPLVIEAALVDVRPPPPKLHAHGVFGAMDDAGLSDDFDPQVKEAASHMGRFEERAASDTLLGDRGNALADGGTAEAGKSPDMRYDSHTGPSFANRSVRAPALPMPPAHRCLAGPSDVKGDEGIAAGKGLSIDQIRRALGGFVRHTAACVPSGSSGTVTVTTQLTVGCNGRVSDAEVHDNGGAPEGVAQCVATVLAHAPFPAHDLPDGVTFDYPVTLQF